MINNGLLTKEESVIYNLRGIYREYGYMPFKMTKFEEYDLYMQNKDFLVSDSIITFNDLDGKLLALKPDVTLSILKSAKTAKDAKLKLYYNENVYRSSQKKREFREITQTGIECIGGIDFIDVYEVLFLAAKSLNSISSDFIIDVSHMGILSSILNSLSCDTEFQKQAIKAISNKSEHELASLCLKFAVDQEKAKILIALVSDIDNDTPVLDALKALNVFDVANKDYLMLCKLINMFEKSEYASKIRVDFSVVNDMSYYNGVVFKGFINGVSESVLSGGEYGTLIRKMNDGVGDAIGFAIYVDLLNNNNSVPDEVDVLLIYSGNNRAETVIEEKNKIVKSGKTVYSSNINSPVNIKYREKIVLEDNK